MTWISMPIVNLSKKERGATEILAQNYDLYEAKALSRKLVEDVYGRSARYPNDTLEAPSSKASSFRRRLQKLEKRHPLAYVVGYTYFLGRKFFVNSHVLIPRPETEELTQLIVKQISRASCVKVLEIGTGSGCVAISLALEGADVDALEVDACALGVAKRNMTHLSASLNLLHGDVFTEQFEKKYDLIVSNPPYIPKRELNLLPEEVRNWEPKHALLVPNEDPLCFYKRITFLASHCLAKEGRVYVETHTHYTKDVARLFKKMPCKNVQTIEDLFGRPRFVVAQF